MLKKKQNKIKDVKNGIQKIKMWLLVLLGLLVFSGGLRLGVVLPQFINFVKVNVPIALDKVSNYFHLSMIGDITESKYWLEAVIGLVLGIILCFVIKPFLPKKEQSFKAIFKDLTPETLFELPSFRDLIIFLYLILAIFSTYLAFVVPAEIVKLVSLVIGAGTFIVVVYSAEILLEVCEKRNSEDYVYFEQNKKNILTITTVVGVLVIGLSLIIPDFWGFSLPELFSRKDMSEYYAAILSLTFISISVMGVLSDKTVIIYWENVAESKLIKPVLFSFAAYTYYSIGATMGAGLCLVLGKSIAFIVFFTINLLAIIALTFTMVDVYYDRGGKKKKLIKELQEDVSDYFWLSEESEQEEHYINPETGEAYTAQEITDKEVGKNRYQDKMMLLRQNIRQAKDEHNLTYLKEVYELYQNHINCFNTPEGKLISKMLFSDCTEENWPLVIKTLSNFVEKLLVNQVQEKKPFESDYYTNGAKWKQDQDMWIALSRTPYLPQLLQPTDKESVDGVEFDEVMLPIVKRLVAFYNDMVAHVNFTTDENFDSLEISVNYRDFIVETNQGTKLDTNQMCKVLENMFDVMVPQEYIPTHMMRILCVILKNAREHEQGTVRRIFSSFPLPNWYTPYLDYITEDESTKEVWEKCFPALQYTDK